MARLAKKAKKAARSITGFSTPIFGFQWNPPKDERETVRQLLVFLEDRRVLYNPCAWEIPEAVYQSVYEIREYLTQVKTQLDEDSPAVGHVTAMRAACRQYLNAIDRNGGRDRRVAWRDMPFLEALGALRALMGIHIAALCEAYGIEVESELRASLPTTEKK